VQAGPDRRGTRAFSLIEILTVVALLSFIIIGLMATFSATQKAWRTSMVQTDVLENGRMATDLLTRDFMAITPSELPGVVNFTATRHAIYSLTPPALPLSQPYPQTPTAPIEYRVNYLQELYFITQENRTWRGVGYRVDASDVNLISSGIGTLYRFEMNSAQPSNGMLDAFRTNAVTNLLFSPIIDGVVHFVARTYDTNGLLLTTKLLSPTNAGGVYGFMQPNGNLIPPHTNIAVAAGLIPDGWSCTFLNNAVPAYVDLEIGVLESRTAEHARAIPNDTVRLQYLQKQLGAVHIFRQRIPIRNVDPEAYR
jgi:type II secretory pathway pseudopilin PulG